MKIDLHLSNLRICKLLAADYFDEVNEWFGEIPNDTIAEIDLVTQGLLRIAEKALVATFPGAIVTISESGEGTWAVVEPEESEVSVMAFVEAHADSWEWQSLMDRPK